MFGFLHALGRGVGGKGGETAALEGLAVGGPVVQGAGGSDLLPPAMARLLLVVN